MRRIWLALIATLVIAGGCSTMKIEDFKGTEPRLRLEEFFAGKSQAWGTFEDRFGNVRRQFTVDIVGTWDGETLVLEEDFEFADGETDRRVWKIVKLDDNTYEGRAEDVHDVARGTSYGNALTWTYSVDLKMKDRSLTVTFEDWMWQLDEDVLLNKAEVRKWGFKVGEATIFFRRMPESSEKAHGGMRSAGSTTPSVQQAAE
ncbi:MAG: DUF3833 domain-containing protein [Rhodovibrionaceae bacterium]|nr:DUF3833 domain-containing protein [Rhodovibrionaceae bacterium]